MPARIQLGKTRLTVGNGEGAEKEFREARKLGADDNLVIVPLLDTLLLQGRYKDVLKEAKPQKYPKEYQSQIYDRMGSAELELKGFDYAEDYFNRSLSIQPGNVRAAGKAMLSLKKGDLETARQRAETIVSKKPSAVEGWLVKAAIAVFSNELDEALRHYEHVILLEPNHLIAILRISSLLFDMQRYQEAVRFINTHREKFPWDPRFPYILVLAHSELGNPQEANKVLDEAFKLISAVSREQMDADLEMKEMVATISTLHGEHQFAVELFEQLKLVNYLDFISRKMFARSLLKIGDYHQVVAVLIPIVEENKADQKVIMLIAQAYEKLGQYKDAIEYYNKALGADGEVLIAGHLAALYSLQKNYQAGIELLENADKVP